MNKKILIGIIVIIIIILSLYLIFFKENFINYPLTWKVNREIMISPNESYSLSGNNQASLNPKFKRIREKDMDIYKNSYNK